MCVKLLLAKVRGINFGKSTEVRRKSDNASYLFSLVALCTEASFALRIYAIFAAFYTI